tara:strand:+ start:342 stop:815 length:474 start_codon:yes stop_codon:yes gene_type:complete
MTRKDFQLIADALKAGFSDCSGIDHVKKKVINSFVKALSGDNERFDAPRFIQASGGWKEIPMTENEKLTLGVLPSDPTEDARPLTDEEIEPVLGYRHRDKPPMPFHSLDTALASAMHLEIKALYKLLLAAADDQRVSREDAERSIARMIEVVKEEQS